MVPTEILAEQHYQSLTKLFEGKLVVEFLTGSVKGKERKRKLAELKWRSQCDCWHTCFNSR